MIDLQLMQGWENLRRDWSHLAEKLASFTLTYQLAEAGKDVDTLACSKF